MKLFVVILKCGRAFKSLSVDLVRWTQVVGDYRSWLQIVGDIIRLKVGLKSRDKNRVIQLRSGKKLAYRLNKGDLWSMREVLLDECYRFPGSIDPKVIVDLGANIGVTSMWLDMQFSVRRIVMVEPEHSNALLAQRNLTGARAEVTLVEAAVGKCDGLAQFKTSVEFNTGSLKYGVLGSTRVISMMTLLHETGIVGEVDLLKVDIEGGEAELFSGNLDWLRRVYSIIAEFHPQIINRELVVDAIVNAGFRHIPASSVFEGNMEAFVREDCR